MQQLAQQLPAELLQLYYDIVVKSRENLALANTPMQALEMSLLRLMAFKPLHHNQIPLRLPIANNPEPQSPDSQLVDTMPSEESIQQSIEESIEQGIEQQVFNDSHFISIDETAVNTPIQQTPPIEDDANRLSDVQPSVSHHETSVPGIVTAPAIVNPPVMVTEDSASIKKNEPASVAVATNVNVNVDNSHHTMAAEGGDIADMSPLALLKPTHVPREGEWTPAKWDYWVFNAREQGWLDDDELVLAKRGVMTGEIHGVSQFVTEQSFLTHTATFDNFCQKLRQLFEGIDIRLAESASNFQALEKLKPEALQEAREKLALQQATHQLEQQAVTQALLQQHASISSVKLIQ